MSTMLDCLSVATFIAGLSSAACWGYGVRTISREHEIARRRKQAAENNTSVNLGGVDLLDGEKSYDLIATLRHQSKWNRNGAFFAALAIALQMASQIAAPI
jgi:hypothetical protein